MPNLAALRGVVFKLFAKNRWGHNMPPPSSARVNKTNDFIKRSFAECNPCGRHVPSVNNIQ